MPATETAPESVAQIIQAMDDEFVRNALAKDADKLVAAFYALDAQLFATYVPPLTGYFQYQLAAGIRLLAPANGP